LTATDENVVLRPTNRNNLLFNGKIKKLRRLWVLPGNRRSVETNLD